MASSSWLPRDDGFRFPSCVGYLDPGCRSSYYYYFYYARFCQKSWSYSLNHSRCNSEISRIDSTGTKMIQVIKASVFWFIRSVQTHHIFKSLLLPVWYIELHHVVKATPVSASK